MTQRHAQISSGNPPVPLELKHYYNLTTLNRAKASRTAALKKEYHLFNKTFFWNRITPKKLLNSTSKFAYKTH